MSARPTLIQLPRLREWRIRRGLSQDALGEQSRTSRVNVSRIELGAFARLSTARKLADALKCSIDDLMLETEPPSTN